MMSAALFGTKLPLPEKVITSEAQTHNGSVHYKDDGKVNMYTDWRAATVKLQQLDVSPDRCKEIMMIPSIAHIL
ncbi:hypothetical protein Ocin01_18621 [Orchesella cincta]|uniref:Uncharacterized protein n=1 Tax=Orchesella cincta TaxID=48709 RepID=A0A1D2M579_ORCCI|nr:hypothetical protein Ocin01_18621 [Orchesella cincta]